MAQLRSAGAEDSAVQVQAQQVVQALLPGLLQGAEPWLLDQATAARDSGADAACLAVLQGDAAARRSLPTALLQRESSWLVDAAAQSPRGPARRRAPPGSAGHLRKSELGDYALNQITFLRMPTQVS
jgi:hypothetical protein